MRKLLPIIALFMLPLTLMLSACGPRRFVVAPAAPICPEQIRLPKAFTDPLPLPIWFVVPAPKTISLLPPPDEQPKCVPSRKAG